MSAPKPRVTQVAIKAPTNVNDLLAQAKNVVTALTGNPYVPAPNPPLPVVKTEISDLESSEAIALTKAKGAAATRNAKRRALLNTMHVLKGSVQLAANADPANAQTIINSAGLSVRAAPAVHPKADLAAKDGITSGSVKLVARAIPNHRGTYDWQWSQDQKAWTTVPSTVQAHTIINGLPVAVTVYFRHRTVTKAGTSDWGQSISIQVR